ncbi:ABC transporter substrate-binding protein [Streptomonospora nanhaiensis]|uniref:ABC transporter substrate-binding protein n=1 Tax=Streptomonospora nanhaiensis TaxID=1323731 RepID=UPI0027E2BD25|nr:ABC transporter substrate-binding protein [Streptomonospora nanhaiensis]
MSKKWLGFAAAGTSVAMLLTACGGGGGDQGGGDVSVDDSAITSIVDESTEQGGTLQFAHSDQFDSLDPGNTYYAANWDFTRLYARTLVTYAQAPGEEGLELVPDLAEDLGKVSNDGLTWTYTLKEGLKYEDGSPITSEDIAYAVARSNYAPDIINKGPTYFNLHLEAGDYAGPYEDEDLDNFEGVSTPDERTIEFHLKEPFAEFDYLAAMPQTAPVPADADTGDQYQTEVVSSGPYKFEEPWNPGQQLNLVRNEEYDPETDPLTRNRPDRIEVQWKQEENDRDNRLINGDLHTDIAGLGVEASARQNILRDEELSANADNPQTGFLLYFAINPNVKPFDNKACREAILYGADKNALQGAWGGSVAGDIATSMLPPSIPGYQEIDPYGTPGQSGSEEDVNRALEECGMPDGFSTNIAYRSDRDKEKKAAEALQQALQQYGIETQLKGYPAGSYTSEQAGSPEFVKREELGIMAYGWGADWPSGYGFLQQIMHGDAIKPAGNSNLSELDDPEVNQLLDDAAQTESAEEREEMYAQVDALAMDSATFLPYLNQKALLFRPQELTNVYFSEAYKMYDYSALGLESGAQN